MNLKLTALAAAMLVGLPMANASRIAPAKGPHAQKQQTEAFRWAPVSKAASAEWQNLRINDKSPFKASPKTSADSSFEPSEGFSYLDMPDGSTWFIATEFDKEILFQNEYYTDYDIVGIKATVYNDKYEKVGYIESPIEKPEGFNRCSQAMFGPCVTKKFFNTNDNYELMLMVNFNPSEGYGSVAKTMVFSLKGASTPADVVSTIDGYYTVAVNNAADSWSEDFFIEFFSNETYSEESYFYTFDIYSKASYSSPTATKIKTFDVDMLYASGDGENETLPVIINSKGSTLYATVSRYQKTFLEDPFDFTNEKMNPDNNYIIELYKKGAWDNDMSLQSTTVVPVLEPEEGYHLRSYAIGMLDGCNDITFDLGDGNTPAFVLSIVNTDVHENTFSYFDVIDTEGNLIKTFGAGHDGYLRMSSVPGQPEQYCFLMPTGDGDYDFEYQFFNWPEMEKVAAMPILTTDGDTNLLLSLSIDRAAADGSYRYAAGSVNGEVTDDDDTFHRVAWFDSKGNKIRVDHLNAGKNINLINPYVGGNALNPYLFNTDEAQEYMLFAQRRDNADAAEAHTELMVVNNMNEVLAQYVFDIDHTGINVAIVNEKTNPAIWITYNSFADKMYHSEFIQLPLNKFEGAGTVADPYLLRTQGDIEQIKFNLNKNFRLANDIDFHGNAFTPISGVFTGSIDGAGYSFRNVALEGKPMFSTLGNLETSKTFIKDLTLRDFKAVDASALIAETSYGVTFDNVKVINATVSGNNAFEFGTLVSNAATGTSISACAVKADIDMPETDDVGGIVSSLGNDSKIIASSFNGSINAASSVGGVAASSMASASIADCHVSADITAAHTVGGIVGSSARSSIKRCFVEGEISANAPRDSWSDYKGTFVKQINAGGIVGSLGSVPTEYDDNGNPLPPDPSLPVIISECVVALDAINIPAESSLRETAHRIVGRSSINDDPMYLGEEYNPDTYDYDIIWGDPAAAENKIDNNYAVDDLAIIDANAGDAITSTEGKGIAYDELERSFFDGLGYQFMGYTAEQPWVMRANNMPELFFETSLGQYMEFLPASISVVEGSTSTAVLHLEGIDVEALTMSSSDETNCFANPVEFDENGDVIVEVTVNKTGTYTITATNGNVSAILTVTGTSGIEGVTVTGTMRYDGSTVTAEDCTIAIFSLDGTAVAHGNGSVDVTTLGNGVYVAVATAADGKKQTLKINVR